MVRIRTMPQEEIQKCVSFFLSFLEKLCSNPDDASKTFTEN